MTVGITGSMLWFADVINLNGNNFPSLHVALVVSAAWAYAPYLSKGWRWLMDALALLVVASTLVAHQHVIADVMAGIALAIFGIGFVYPRAQRIFADTKTQLGAAVSNGAAPVMADGPAEAPASKN